MKKSVFIICFGALQLASFGQIIDTTIHPTDLGLQYAQRSKNGKAAGYVLLGVGLISFATGAAIATSDLSLKNREGEFAVIAGTTMVVASIPVFIIAGSNKRKSRIHLRQEKSNSYSGNIHRQAVVAWKLDL